MKKKILTTALLAASVMTLTSCGGSGSELTIFLHQDGQIYNSDMAVYQRANEYADITLEGVLQKYDTNYDSIYNLRGKDANLVVNDQDTIEATALKDGIFLDLTSLIAEHAPNLKAFFDKNPEKKDWATASDGKIYGIPFYTDGQTAKAFFVRQDWVNKLADNNKLPNGVSKDKLNDLTVEQFHDLLLAFKNNKSLLTKADKIYPYFDRDSDFAISELASLWGATAEYYLDDEGKVKYGATQNEFRYAMEQIAKWYSEGLIEPDILNKSTEDKRVTLFAQDSGGATHDWLGTTYSFNDDVYKANLVDGFKVICIAPPTRSDGTKHEPTIRKQIGTVTAINASTSAEDQIKLMKWIDFWFTEEGHDTLNFGIKDVHYTKTGSEYAFTDKIINDKGTALENLYRIGAQLQSPGCQTFAYEEAWLSPEAKAAMSLYQDSKNSDNSPYLNVKYNKLIYPNIKLSNEDYQKVNTSRSAVNTVYFDQINKWMKGTQQINNTTWAAYVAAMEKAGTTVITSTIQKYVK